MFVKSFVMFVGTPIPSISPMGTENLLALRRQAQPSDLRYRTREGTGRCRYWRRRVPHLPAIDKQQEQTPIMAGRGLINLVYRKKIHRGTLIYMTTQQPPDCCGA